MLRSPKMAPSLLPSLPRTPTDCAVTERRRTTSTLALVLRALLIRQRLAHDGSVSVARHAHCSLVRPHSEGGSNEAKAGPDVRRPADDGRPARARRGPTRLRGTA